MRPPELEKPSAGTDGPDSPPNEIVFERMYRQDSRRASSGRLKLVDDGTLGEIVLERACTEIRDRRARLPLWSHRLGGWAGAGRIPYRRAWDELFQAGIDAGGSEHWVRQCLFHGFASSNVAGKPSPRLAELAQRGLS